MLFLTGPQKVVEKQGENAKVVFSTNGGFAQVFSSGVFWQQPPLRRGKETSHGNLDPT